MGKLVVQFALIVASFFVMWKLVEQVDWMTWFHVEQTGERIEEKIGETYWTFFRNTEEEVVNKEAVSAVDRLLATLCNANQIDRESIRLHLLNAEEVNAFALPGGHIVVYTGLILDCENESELSGVLAHELAHLQLGHIMKKLVKEVGLSVLISMTGGNGSPEMIRHAVKALTSSAYDRSLEQEADLKAVEYLTKSQIDPEGLANFLFRMAVSESDIRQQLIWLSTHPGGEERAKAILDQIPASSVDHQQVLSTDQWDKLQESLQSMK
jgi:predicted Zn-dependent protease